MPLRRAEAARRLQRAARRGWRRRAWSLYMRRVASLPDDLKAKIMTMVARVHRVERRVDAIVETRFLRLRPVATQLRARQLTMGAFRLALRHAPVLLPRTRSLVVDFSLRLIHGSLLTRNELILVNATLERLLDDAEAATREATSPSRRDGSRGCALGVRVEGCRAKTRR